MFDIGFSELLLVALVALLVFGPERLPGAVRTGSLLLGRLKRSVQSIKQEVARELGADEIRQQLHNEEILRMERELKQSLQSAKDSLQTPLAEPSSSDRTEPESPAATPETDAPTDLAQPPRQP